MSDAAETPIKSSVILDVNSDHGFATLTLNRPDRLNSLSNELLESFANAIESVAQDDAIRAVIITGSGRAFCAGADTDEMTGGEGEGPHKPGPGGPEVLRRGFKLAQKVILGIYEMENLSSPRSTDPLSALGSISPAPATSVSLPTRPASWLRMSTSGYFPATVEHGCTRVYWAPQKPQS
jgi:hypothetical protein